nr:MAG: nonstructural protein [Microvirus sp.]
MKKLYTIYDSASSMAIGGVHVFAHDAAAIRFFGDLVADPQTMMGRHPNDHELRCVAAFDEEDCSLLTEGYPLTVATGAAIKATQDQVAANLAQQG